MFSHFDELKGMYTLTAENHRPVASQWQILSQNVA